MNYTNSEQRLRARKPSPPAEGRTVFSIETDKRGTHLRVRRPGTMLRRAIIRAGATLALTWAAAAQIITLDFTTPTLDKNGYPFSPSGGGPRTAAFTFGSFGTSGTFDDRDSQMIAGFDTHSHVPTGLGAGSYAILSAKFTLTLDFSAADAVIWDGTYDPISTYASDGSPAGGDDAGRPIELYGAGYRNGFTATSITENTPFSLGDPTLEGVRNIYATDFLGGVARDISNNIRDAFDPVPFAIGQVAPEDLNPDGTMKADASIVFTLNLANPNVIAYLQQALNAGRVNLIASSLHLASLGGAVTYPVFQTKESPAAIAPRLQMQVALVPEPRAGSLAIIGAALVACWRSRRRILEGGDLP